jgi:hypothetical protein
MKKNTLIFLVLFSALSLTSRAQFSVTLFPQADKQFFIDDLWKTMFINTATSNQMAYVQFSINATSGAQVVTITLPIENFSKGLNQVTSIEARSGKWAYASTQAAVILQQTGKLPFGTYMFCANIYAATTNKLLGSDCEERDVKPMTPPELANPSNKEEITTTTPALVWIPPRPTDGLPITYSLRLAEVDSGQNPSLALLQNPPLLNLNALSNTSLLYPADAPVLQNGKQYVWQVAAAYEGYNLGVTDMWLFKVKQPVYKNTDEIIYPVADKKGGSRYYISHGIIRFAYDNKANDSKLHYTIRNIGKTDKIKSLPEVDIRSGINKVEVNLKDVLEKGNYYALEIKDSQHQTYKLTFYCPE